MLHFPNGLHIAERQIAMSMLADIPHEFAQALLDELCFAMEARTIRTTSIHFLRALVGKFLKGRFEPCGAVKVAERRRSQVDTFKPPFTNKNCSSKEVARAGLVAAKNALQLGREKNNDR